MANDVQKTPFARSLTSFVDYYTRDFAQLSGKSLPCSVTAVHNAMVTVKFEMQGNGIAFPSITIPQAISRYARPPPQVGDKGFVVAADVYLGGVTGLGGGTATFGQTEANLTTLVYVPLSNMAWPAVDPNAYNITAPNGAVIKDDGANCVITLTSSTITITQGAGTISLAGGTVSLSGTVVINGRQFLAHEHSGVMSGGGNSGGVV